MPKSKAVIVAENIPLHHLTIDLTGKRFSRLTVLCGALREKRPQFMWKCQCDCGNVTFVHPQPLRDGKTRSCGCFEAESRDGRHTRSHGMTGTRIYGVWNAMLRRCRNPKDISYPRYGAIGIRVCERWHKFENFLEDMGEGAVGWSIERLNGRDNYRPENCCWSNPQGQANNTKRNVKITVDGITRTLSQWAHLTGMKVGTLWFRVRTGWDHKRAIFHPARAKSGSNSQFLMPQRTTEESQGGI